MPLLPVEKMPSTSYVADAGTPTDISRASAATVSRAFRCGSIAASGSPDEVRVFAPGRVNLIGEHTDYSGGLVLPVAVHLGITVTAEPSADVLRLRSPALASTVELAPDGSSPALPDGWGRYVAAVAKLLGERGRRPVGLDGSVVSTVPVGAGLSSSAALTVSVALALGRAASFELPPPQLAT